jgi:MGT family glycosyltransferase
VTLCNAIACDPDPLVPPPNTDWDVPKTWLGRLRNRATYRSVDLGFTPMRRRINSYRKKWGLPPIRSFYESFSPLLEIAQETEEFDLPRAKLPPQFRYVGLLRRQTVSSIPFPFERLDGRPIVYGSLGTVVSDTRGLFQGMSEACAALNLQLVITLGHSADIEKYANLPGQPIVVSYAPQFELLRRAALTICHGGHNTVLDSLDYGVPVIAIPLFSDNHGAAVRLQRSGAGERILPKEFNAERLRGTIHRMLAESRYQERARAMQASLKHAGGIARAVDLIEAAVSRSA